MLWHLGIKDMGVLHFINEEELTCMLLVFHELGITDLAIVYHD